MHIFICICFLLNAINASKAARRLWPPHNLCASTAAALQAWNGTDRFLAECQLIWTATDPIGLDRLQLGMEQTCFTRNGT